jgi:hypothetical protein
MGIKRLYSLFKSSFEEKDIFEYRNQKCAIDMMGWLYQGYFSLLEYGGDNTLLVIRSIERKISILEKNKIKVKSKDDFCDRRKDYSLQRDH